MKITKLFLILSIITIALGCNKEVYLLNPIITTKPFEPSLFDTVTTILIGELEIDGEPIAIDSFTWQVFDQLSNEIPLVSVNNNVMKWIPEAEGIYNVEVLVTAGNKSVKEIKQFQIKLSSHSIQNILVGEWEGISKASYQSERWVNFTIEPNGHYTAYSVNGGSIGSYAALGNGNDGSDNPNKKIIIEYIKDNGYADGYINFVHHSFGELLTYGINNLKFSADYNTLTFSSGHWIGEQQRLHFNLVRQD